MRVEQYQWYAGNGTKGWRPASDGAQIVLVFGSREQIEAERHFLEIREAFPGARLFGCSTAGEILGCDVRDDTVTATAVTFERTAVRFADVRCGSGEESRSAGAALVGKLAGPGLRHVLILSPGLGVNGSELIGGIREALPAGVTATGGMAGDGERFEKSFVICDDHCCTRTVVGMGLYGDAIRAGYGSAGRWDPFGPDRLVTKSRGNVLYELDGRPALELYKKYLGGYADALPASALLFPMSLESRQRGTPRVVRSVLSVDEGEQSLTFGGGIPEGHRVSLLRANVDRLVDGAMDAAQMCCDTAPGPGAALAILVSCLGRKMVMKQRVEEELEGVREVLGQGCAMTGFYSYGEFAPVERGGRPELHNESMTVTTLVES